MHIVTYKSVNYLKRIFYTEHLFQQAKMPTALLVSIRMNVEQHSTVGWAVE